MENIKKGPILFGDITPEEGLRKALSMTRAEVISEVRNSGLKGRGGAGFPTGVKWNLAAAAQNDPKFLICNADEGEPGTFKDRVLLTEHANLVFEGMTIGGYAIGSKLGIVYLRGEYRYLLAHLKAVREERREKGLLGENVLGKQGFHFDIDIRLGSGAYVCGEETALIESLEGNRGEPRNRPPYPVDTGLLGNPTVVNNVETLCLAARVVAKGAEWFKAIGTDKSTGSKLLSISGDCARPGVYEFPMGTTVQEVLQEVGGEGAKAVQVGGASGFCLPSSQFSRKIAFEDMPTGGSIIVFGPQRDMLLVAKNFMEFFVEESCGQCTPCRYGNVALLDGVKMLEEGRCTLAHLKELTALGETMQIASKCGLGQSSPNAFLSIVDHFQNEILGRESAFRAEARRSHP
jgi:[NiFe] hydrogenase diaphorase moiety large subunit